MARSLGPYKRLLAGNEIILIWKAQFFQRPKYIYGVTARALASQEGAPEALGA